MKTRVTQASLDMSELYSHDYIDGKNLYLLLMDKLPSILYVNNFNVVKAYNAFVQSYANSIKNIYTYNTVNFLQKPKDFEHKVVVLHTDIVLEFHATYCDIFYDVAKQELADELIQFFKAFKTKGKRKPFEINILIRSGAYLEFKSMEVKRTKLDLNLFYNDDFKEIDELITKRLNQANDKGIVLLHGVPGSGKTTYLRYLIGKLKKKVIFLSPNMASCIADPDFIELLIDNPNSVLIIEDAENIITDRKINSNSSVSNLLNISDGLLADFLNVQLICTFNNALTLVDTALMRKGRLIAKYEFSKLNVAKSKALAAHVKSDIVVDKPMSVAEITNLNGQAVDEKQFEVIGFRRSNEILVN